MRILVTGASGFLGRSLLSLKGEGEAEWIGCGRGSSVSLDGIEYHQVDLESRASVLQLLETLKPDWVINTAALTNVDQCEVDRRQARRANLEIVEHLVEGCRRTGTGLVQISTDYVFDGTEGPYSEEDPPRPLSYYGQLKLESEKRVLESGCRGIVVRTLWLYGYVPEARPNFVTRSLEGLYRGERLRIFDDQWGNPTYVHDLARTLFALCRRGSRGLFHMGGATFMTRYELVLELSRFFGLDTRRIEPISTQSAGLKAMRPLRSGLRTQAIEAELGRKPLSFIEGLEQMVKDDHFRRDFPHLLQV